MKKINVILIFLLSCLSIDSYAQKKDLTVSNNSTIFNNLLVQQSALLIKKNSWIIALAPLMIYHHKDIKEIIMHWPYASSLGFYLILNYVCDSIVHYQQQQSLLNTIRLLKKITLYLTISHGIKNYVYHTKLSFEPFVQDDLFLDSITKDLPYSFHEVSLIALKSYQELKMSLQSLNDTLHIESEEFIFLCHASSINIHSLLYLVQNDPNLYALISDFEKDPQNKLESLVEYLTSQITEIFMDLQQQLLIANVP